MLPDREYLLLPDGKLITLPLCFCPLEFQLPGNWKALIDGRMYACYDETTRTGAIWRASPVSHWIIMQPCLREDFFNRLCPNAIAAGFPD
jgi:hypothetical protein